MGENIEIKKIKCPMCKSETTFSAENKYRPFCSERCQLLDLGAWASEDYKVPLQENTHVNLEDEFELDEGE